MWNFKSSRVNQLLPKRLTADLHGPLLYFDYCVTSDKHFQLFEYNVSNHNFNIIYSHYFKYLISTQLVQLQLAATLFLVELRQQVKL